MVYFCSQNLLGSIATGIYLSEVPFISTKGGGGGLLEIGETYILDHKEGEQERFFHLKGTKERIFWVSFIVFVEICSKAILPEHLDYDEKFSSVQRILSIFFLIFPDH